MLSFRPLPLLGNPHVQTILGNYLNGERRNLGGMRRVVALPDGDRIALSETPPHARHAHQPIALLVHGLGGCHRSANMVRVTTRLSDLGWRVVRMDLRGAGAGVRLARRYYNAACSDDIRVVIEHLAAAYPESPIAVVGFSLGGNIVLKLAGEGADLPMPAVRAVAALGPPIDLVRCSELLACYPLYDAFYVRNLTRQVAQHQELHPDVQRIVFPRRTTLRQFDDLYTAPRWGYASALDYYRRASALPWVPRIRVPTFILTARDDPFVAVEPFETVAAPPTVEIHISEHGGHLGFLGPDGNGGIRWGETRLIQWLERQMAQRVC
ncbi:MAG: alpha/beta fold hydrolase [Gemmataceae bacterium]|nr:alpha/beta fold hydrolase [Gemmataceae bacterium]